MNSRERAFIKKVYTWYQKNGRHDLPWRLTHNPYHIWVSEVMLQQTQVARVQDVYVAFLKAFPTLEDVAQATLREVLLRWQGLGYNRRACLLHQAAQRVSTLHKGILPHTVADLQELPGIGPYTARAIMIFAYQQPEVCIETNIRSVYIHEFFSENNTVTDIEIMPYIERTLDTQQPHMWYAALMDYGTFLKKSNTNPSRKSAHHCIQKKFKGSLRETRGSIVTLLVHQSRTQAYLIRHAQGVPTQIASALHQLSQEGVIMYHNRLWHVAA